MKHNGANPYQAPVDDLDRSSVAWANIHQWSGHSIRMASRANPKTLWLVRNFIVSVDDAPPSKTIFPVGQVIPLSFQHEGRRVQGKVTREQSLIPGAVEYSLAIEDKPVDNGMIQTGNLRLGTLTFVAAFGLAVDAPFYVLPMCVVASFTCLLATVRLMGGGLECLLPARKHNGG